MSAHSPDTIPVPSKAYTFSLVTAAAFALQAGTGFFLPNVYQRDTTWVASVLRGTDCLALVLVLPLLLLSHMLAQCGSARWRLVWIGVLYKVFYNNLYLVLGTNFNRFFLLYLAVFVLSSFAVVTALLETDASEMVMTVLPCQRKSVAGILFVEAAILTVMWVGQCLVHVATGKLPSLVPPDSGTHLIAALDLTTIVPVMVVGGVLLWKAQPWGYVVATGMLVQSLLIVVDLIVTPAFQAAAGVDDAFAMVPLWALMGLGFAGGAGLVLRGRPCKEQGCGVVATCG